MILKHRKSILVTFGLLCILSVWFVTKLKFTFDFEQFFPQGDEDLEFFRNFTSEFETDDNFLLIAVENESGVFEESFLQNFHNTSLGLREVPYVNSVQSLTTMRYPIKTPFGYNSLPIIHIDDPSRYEEDRQRILSDPRFVNNLINEKATALCALVKTKDRLSVQESEDLMINIREILSKNKVDSRTHMLGRAYFQTDLIKHQKREIILSSVISSILVSLILFLIYRQVVGVVIALGSIGISLLIFMGVMGALGRPLSIMSALYPVLMLIVGTSDVIHIMSKYVDELKRGLDKATAIRNTVTQIGMATFLTSATTAVGFATLLTSRLAPVRDFGINSALGVMIAYGTTILVTTSLLSFFDKDQILKKGHTSMDFWDRIVAKTYQMTLRNRNQILIGFAVVLLVCYYGISQVSTNYKIENNLPLKERITEDFHFFEREFSGFRPLEFAITVKGDYKADDYEIVKEINKLEERLLQTPEINSIISQATLYKSLARMNAGNTLDAYQFPETKEEFDSYKKILARLNAEEATVLINKNNDKTRISSKVEDIGADSIKALGAILDRWIDANLDASKVSVKRTGTGLIIDKNSVYVTESLIYGLGLAIIIISLLMAFLLKRWKMLFLAFIANIIPVYFAGALLGFFDIELEAGISIVFAVIFGIAVDDTIHFLSKYKLCRVQKLSIEDSLETTFKETGKAIFFTTVVLFFGFLVMLFSQNPPTKTVGLLISVTLLAALLADVLLLPVLIRTFIKEDIEPIEGESNNVA